MDNYIHEVRTSRWRSIIQSCQQRPVGQTAKQWLQENQILEQSYYYWLRKLRNEAYSQMEQSNLPIPTSDENNITFAELEVSSAQEVKTTEPVSDVIMPVAVIKTAGISIAISNDISESLLAKLLQEVSHA